MEKFRAGLVQMDSGPNVNENMQAIEGYLREAVNQGARFVMFPETSEYIGPDMAVHANTVPGYVTRRFASLAKHYGVYVHCGSITAKRGAGKPENRSYLFRPDGELLACYSKLHMFDVDVPGSVFYQESAGIRPGNEIVLADTEFATFGMSICYDIRFPELYRLMALNGADVMLAAANFTKVTGEKHWETLLRARAIENACYVLAAGQCGRKYGFEAYGHSMIIDPNGEILSQAGQKPAVLVAELDPGVLVDARRQIPALYNRREDVYDLVTDELRVYGM